VNEGGLSYFLCSNFIETLMGLRSPSSVTLT